MEPPSSLAENSPLSFPLLFPSVRLTAKPPPALVFCNIVAKTPSNLRTRLKDMRLA